MTVPVGKAVPLRPDVVGRWLCEDSEGPIDAEIGARRPLPGGVASPAVERVEVMVVRPSGRRETREIVAKRASEAEATALVEIASVPGAEAFPELIDAGRDEDGPWVVMPFYAGTVLEAGAEFPAAVYESLARLHARHLGRTESLPTVYQRVDKAFCADALTNFAVSGIHDARARHGPHPVHARALDLLPRWARDPRLLAGIDVLPTTLLHGDAYGLNVIKSLEGAWLIDWGNARVGPAMLDVSMSAGRSSAGVQAYLQAWESATGTPMPRWEVEAGHAWATAMNSAMFVGAVADRFGPEPAQRLLDMAGDALDRLGALQVPRRDRHNQE